MFCFAQFFHDVKGYLMSPDTFSRGPFDIVNKHRNINIQSSVFFQHKRANNKRGAKKARRKG